jgi:hypothetical protein
MSVLRTLLVEVGGEPMPFRWRKSLVHSSCPANALKPWKDIIISGSAKIKSACWPHQVFDAKRSSRSKTTCQWWCWASAPAKAFAVTACW